MIMWRLAVPVMCISAIVQAGGVQEKPDRPPTLAEVREEIRQQVDLLYSHDENVKYRARARIREVGQPIIPALILDLRAQSPSNRWHAAVALGVISSQSALPALYMTLENDDSYLVRGCSAQAIGEICSQYDNQDGLPHLMAALDDADAFVAQRAVEALIKATGESGPQGVAQLPVKEAVRLWKAWWEQEANELSEHKQAVKENLSAIHKTMTSGEIQILGWVPWTWDRFSEPYLCVALREPDQRFSVRIYHTNDQGDRHSLLTLRNTRMFSHMYPEDIDGDQSDELFVIWRDKETARILVEVLSTRGDALVNIFQGEAQYGFKLFDLDADGVQELILSGVGDAQRRIQIDIYRLQQGTYQQVHSLYTTSHCPFPKTLFENPLP